MTIPSKSATIRDLRLRVLEFASACLFSAEELADLESAVGEACNNAYRHGSPRGEEDTITVKCMRNHSAVIVEVQDNGRGFDPASIPLPCPEKLREGGMGIFLMHRLTDGVEFEFNRGTRVRMIKYRKHRA